MNITVRMNLNDKQIKRAVNKAMKPTLMGAGRYVMNIVRASIHQRRDPNKSAAPRLSISRLLMPIPAVNRIPALRKPSFMRWKKAERRFLSARSLFVPG